MHYGFSINPKLGWKPALDGMRGFAILAVMLSHFQYDAFNDDAFVLLPGGGIGVDLFFVLSGFLITTLLLQEWAAGGSLSIVNFYFRRALRLLPAVAAFLLGFLVIAAFVRTPTVFTGEVSTTVLAKNVVGVLTYSFNWLMALQWDHVWGLGHLWSLSVEEQFYFVWPLSLLVLLRLRVSPWQLLGLTAAVFSVSASLPFVLTGYADDRFYFGTDYRIHTILAGCLLAQLYVGGMLKASDTRRFVFRAGLLTSIVFLVVAAAGPGNEEGFLFAGGYTFVAVAAGVVLVAAVYATGGPGHWLLTNPVIVYLGKRSYALYLWHYGIAYWLRDLDTVPQIALSFAASLLAAELSHRLVEAPALRLKTRFGPTSEAPAAPAGAAASTTGGMARPAMSH